MKKNSLASNILVAFVAQGISMTLSILISFIVPKVLDVESFSYWQLFIFYISYVGIFHFGINDGVYLKYGGMTTNEMDKELVSGQFKILVAVETVLSILLLVVVKFIDLENERYYVLFMTCIYMFFANTGLYIGYIFQAANKTKLYSYSVIIDKVFFLVLLIGLFIAKNDDFRIYIIAYLVGKIICAIFCYIKGREIAFAKITNWKRVSIELIDSIRAGIKLTISSMSSMFILGCGRFFLDSCWGITVFGKVSFALSLSSFALAFISQVSMVLFPYLRRKESTQIKTIFMEVRNMLFLILPLIYVLYIPAKHLLINWLPQYEDSLTYLGILLPICLFDAKMNLLCNTFFKVMRGEKDLLRINLISVIISFVTAVFATFVLNSYWVVIVSMVSVVAFRSIFAEYVLGKKLENHKWSTSVEELLISIAFCVVSTCLRDDLAFVVVFILYLILLAINRKYISQMIKFMKSIKS